MVAANKGIFAGSEQAYKDLLVAAKEGNLFNCHFVSCINVFLAVQTQKHLLHQMEVLYDDFQSVCSRPGNNELLR